MSQGNTYENDMLLLEFNNTNIANVGDATGLRGSSTAGSLYFSLHSADPGEAGAQNTSEVSYTSYARVAVPRSSSGFTVTNNEVTNAAAIDFPKCTGSTATARFWGLGTASSGAGKLLYRGVIGPGSVLAGVGEATGDTLTIPGHAFAVSDQVVFFAAPFASLPTGITEGTVYYVKTVSGDAITISATDGGTTINITAAGAFLCVECSPLSISTNIVPTFPAGEWVLSKH